MKQVNITSPLRMMVLLLGLFLSVGAFAQIDVKGHVKDAQGEPIIGATVRVVGTQTATVTDFDGNFVLKANQGADISVSYVPNSRNHSSGRCYYVGKCGSHRLRCCP